MGSFISWIRNKNDGKIFFLTDGEVFSDKGIRVLSEFQDDDFFGHEAIRIYFGFGSDEGWDCELRDFWNLEKLPPELQEKLSSFEEFYKYWGKMWEKGYFQNDNFLVYLISIGPEEWRVNIWEQLVRQAVPNNCLRYIILTAPEEWKSKASEQLLKQNFSKSDLCCIICDAPEEWKAKASEQLLKQDLSNYHLNFILFYAPEEWKAKASEQLLKQDPSDNDLLDILSFASGEWKEKARGVLRKRGIIC